MKFARILPIAAAIGALGLMAASPASAIIVGGVDFGTTGEKSHLETTTLAETLITGNGQMLMGYGQVNTVNGNLLYAGGDRLYFVFKDYLSNDFSPTATDFSGGVVNVYKGATFNLLNNDSPTNVTLIEGMTPWLTLAGHAVAGGDTLKANGTLTGSVVNFSGQGLLDATGGLADVLAYMNADNIADGLGGFADVSLTTSGNNNVLNANDNVAGCDDGTAAFGTWCIAGSADLRGTRQVPEPGTLALIGAALLGAGAARRSRKSA